MEDRKTTEDKYATSQDLVGLMTETTTTVHEDENVATTLVTDASTKDNDISFTLAGEDTESLPMLQALHPSEGSNIDVPNEKKCGDSNVVVDDKKLGGELDMNVVEVTEGGICTTDVLDETVTEPVSDAQVKQVEMKRLVTDVDDSTTNVSETEGDSQSAVVADICSKLVPGDNVVDRVKTEPCCIDVLNDPSTESVSVPDDQVKQAERERPMMHVDEFTTNLSKPEGDQPVTVNTTTMLVPGNNANVNEVKTKLCVTEILDESTTEQVFVSDDQIENEARTTDVAESTTNVSKTEGDNQSAVVADICSKLVPGDNVVDQNEGGQSTTDVLDECATEQVSVSDDQIENEVRTTDVAESTTNVSRTEGDNPPAVTADINAKLVPSGNVVKSVQGEQSTTEFDVSNLVDQVDDVESGRSPIDEPVKNVHSGPRKDDTSIPNGAKEDDQSVTPVVLTTLVRADNVDEVDDENATALNVVDKHVESSTVGACNGGCSLPSSGSTCSEWQITQDVHSSGAEAISIRALSAGSPSECKQLRSGYVDIGSVKLPEQVSHAPSSHIASVSGKEGLPKHEDKVEGKEL